MLEGRWASDIMPLMWRRIGILSAIVVIVGVAIAGSGVDNPVAAISLQRGDDYRDAYLYTIATDHYLQALDRQPSNPTILLRLCDVWLRRGQPQEAAAYAERAERAGADRVEPADCRARVAEAQGQWARAAEAWSIVAQARPDDRATRARLIDALIAAHDWPSASAQAGVWLEADPANATALYYRGALLALDDPLEARSHLEAAGSAEASTLAAVLADPLALANRAYRAVSIGRVWLDHDRLPLAWRALLDATTENPNYAEAFAYLGTAYDRLGDATLAGAYLDRALELDDESAVSLYLRGVYLMRRQQWAEARLDLTRASVIDPENASIAFALGRILAEQGDYAGAEIYFTGAVARQPDNLDWQLALADLYIGRLVRVSDDGLAAARRAVELGPDNAIAHDWLGWGLHLAGDEEQAEFHLRVAVDLDPAMAQTRLHLGKFLIDGGRLEEGRTELMRAADLDPAGAVGARARQWLGEPSP